MIVDLTMVLWRPSSEVLPSVLDALACSSAEYRKLHILYSGATSARVIDANLLRDLRLAKLTIRPDNLGFAEGQNLLLSSAFASGADACLMVNPDLLVSRGAISSLIQAVQAQRITTSIVGPTLLRSDGLVDSEGIVWTKSGRHFDRGNGLPLDMPPGGVEVTEGVTGACMLVCREPYERIVGLFGHFFDPSFIAYREDAELGVRAAAVGVESRIVSASGFVHDRGVREGDRSNAFVNCLGVQNRLTMRWTLGQRRPGARALRALRDILVVVAAFTIERSSSLGVKNAWRIRRRSKGIGMVLDRTWLARADSDAPNPPLGRL